MTNTTATGRRLKSSPVWNERTPVSLALLAGFTFVGELPPPAERRRIREGAGLALEDIATTLRTRAATVHQWEAGRVTPSGAAYVTYGRILESLAALA